MHAFHIFFGILFSRPSIKSHVICATGFRRTTTYISRSPIARSKSIRKELRLRVTNYFVPQVDPFAKYLSGKCIGNFSHFFSYWYVVEKSLQFRECSKYQVISLICHAILKTACHAILKNSTNIIVKIKWMHFITFLFYYHL